MAVEAEAAGFDGVMVSEHVALGPGADAEGLPENPRDYALPGNQDPSMPWPDPLLLLAAVAPATTRLRFDRARRSSRRCGIPSRSRSSSRRSISCRKVDSSSSRR